MRVRFFIIILSVLLVTVAGVATIQSRFARTEQAALVDRRIEEMASSLYSSDLSVSEIEDVEEANDIISDALGQERVDLVIAVYDRSGKAVYANRNLTLLGGNFSIQERWQTVERGHHLVRILTLRLPNTDRILQVGMLMDRDLIRWRQINTRLFLTIAVVLMLVVGASYFLSGLLLKPLRVLVAYMRHLATSLGTYMAGEEPTSLTRLRKFGAENRDEVGELAEAVQRMVEHLREAARSQTARTAQLAHELKTPLTIARNSVEALASGGARDSAVCEIDRLTLIINGFLEWSVLENTAGEMSGVHAIRLSTFVSEQAARFTTLHPGRLQVALQSDGTIFARPAHLDQVFSNLLANALKYSAGTVDVILVGFQLKVRDHGAGIPESVLARLGTPFNRADSSDRTGTGLGLAWVQAICRRYDWKLNIQSSPAGTEISLDFPKG